MGLILDAFERTCRDRREAPALWSRGEGIRRSFAELAAAVTSWAGRLPAVPGEVTALATGNCAAFPELFLALRRRGVPVACLDGAQPLRDKVSLCRRLGIPSLLVLEGPGLGALGGITVEALGGGIARLHLPDLEAASPPPGTALIKLTSGSTGEPVGICLGEEALAAGIAQIAAGMELGPADRVLVAIPLSHSYGFDNGVLSLAAVGTPLILEPGYYPGSLLRALAEGEATFFPAVPPMIRALADSDWPSGLGPLRVISAGGPLDPAFACRFRQRAGRPVHQFYGSTETGGISFERRPDEAEARGTVGEPLPGVEVELAADATIRVDSAANFLAVLGQPPRGGRRVTLGDRGEWTAEGRLRLIGRCADLLNVGGRRVSAAAIESCLKSLPGITEAAVVAVADPVRGDRVVAFVVGRPGPLDPCRLPAGLAPRDLRPIDALPYTDRGKLDRDRLRRLAAEPG